MSTAGQPKRSLHHVGAPSKLGVDIEARDPPAAHEIVLNFLTYILLDRPQFLILTAFL